jgi:hypothetical protein
MILEWAYIQEEEETMLLYDGLATPYTSSSLLHLAGKLVTRPTQATF